jgi:cellulose synthase/poly-beta-1,6-N-acetylglucosamine synthase-like glycosyltransferase
VLVEAALRTVRLVCGLVVAVYSIRRVLFLLASFRRATEPGEPADDVPSLTILVPCRDEARTIGRLLEAVDQADYPPDRLSIVLVDDGSRDGTAALLTRWADAGPSRTVVQLPVSGGKARALSAATEAAPGTDLIGVCDADLRPRPDYWRRLAEIFADDRVGAVSGFLHPVNHDASIVSRYAAVETWVHQLVTSRAKDTLGLNPPTHGASVYRRTALEEVGGFAGVVWGDDVTTTAALTSAGWTTRYVDAPTIDNVLVDRWSAYWNQHVRWTSSVFDGATVLRRRSQATRARRLEAWLASAGYLDRLGFLGTCLLVRGSAPGRVLAVLYASIAGFEVWVAVARGGVSGRRRLAYIAAVATVFPADIVATAAAVVGHRGTRDQHWRSPR